jgi:hypothetical protein
MVYTNEHSSAAVSTVLLEIDHERAFSLAERFTSYLLGMR